MVVLIKSTPTQKINYLYNATGQKVAKKVTNNSTETMTDYLNGFHYENKTLRFFATAEGYVDIRARSSDILRANYVYNYTDHLGNIRVSYAFRNTTGQAEIMEENHYYPFGLKHKKYGSVDKELVCVDEDCYEVGIDVVPPMARKTYQYKYNGKEFQDELGLNWTSMDYRNYDNALGRFHNMDRLAELAPSINPYRFAFNNPVYWSDPTGLLEQKSKDIMICPTCPNSPEFQPFIDNPDIFYSFDPETEIITQHTPVEIEEVKITNSKTSNKSQNNGYFASYFKDYFSYKRPAHANAYSPYIPTNRDIAGGLQTVGNGLAYTGYALTLTGVFAEVGVPLAALGNGMSTVGFAFDIYLDWEEGNTELAKFKAGAFAVNYFANRIGVRTAGKTTFKGASKADEKLGKKQMETVIEAQINFYTDKIIENQQNGNK